MAKIDENAVHKGRIQEAATRQPGAVEIATEDDGKTTVLKNVLIVGKTSRNRRRYSEEALRGAVPLYEASEVFIGHTKDGSNPPFDRTMGIIRNPHLTGDGIRADHAFPSGHRMAEDLTWRALHAPKGVGYSHDAEVSWNYASDGWKNASEISKVFSVDLVTRPATTSGMTEDEENIPAEQRNFAEHAFSALSDCRSVILSDATLTEKRERLLEALGEFHSELLEGEIADNLEHDAPHRRLREVYGEATRQLDNSMWDSSKYPKHHNKIDRHRKVLADWSKELTKIPCNCPECGGKAPTTKEEVSDMELKDLTIDTIAKERPDLVAKLQGTDEHTRLTEEAKTAKAQLEAAQAEVTRLKDAEAKRVHEEATAKAITEELAAAKFPTKDAKAFSARFQEDLKRAKDATERAEIIKDRLSLVTGRVQEDRLPAPLANMGGEAKGTSGANPANDRFFGVK